MAPWFTIAAVASAISAGAVGFPPQRPHGAAEQQRALVRVGPAASRPKQSEQSSNRFRSSVDVVSVAAVVRDRKGRFVSDLAQKDFTVVEAGESKPILSFRADEEGPVTVALVLDVSGSMRIGPKVAAAKDAARHVLSGLRPDDRAALFAFDTRLECVQQFTSDFDTLIAAIDRVSPPFGQTSLYDAVAATASAVAESAAPRGSSRLTAERAAIVVLTDGVDTRSRLRPEQVSAIASGIDVPVYVMAVMSGIDDHQQFDGPDAGASGGLRDLARWTGGELFTMSSPAHASLAARHIVQELRHSYVLAFAASPNPGWRALEVRAKDRHLVVRARSGYAAGVRATSAGAAETVSSR